MTVDFPFAAIRADRALSAALLFQSIWVRLVMLMKRHSPCLFASCIADRPSSFAHEGACGVDYLSHPGHLQSGGRKCSLLNHRHRLTCIAMTCSILPPARRPSLGQHRPDTQGDSNSCGDGQNPFMMTVAILPTSEMGVLWSAKSKHHWRANVSGRPGTK